MRILGLGLLAALLCLAACDNEAPNQAPNQSPTEAPDETGNPAPTELTVNQPELPANQAQANLQHAARAYETATREDDKRLMQNLLQRREAATAAGDTAAADQAQKLIDAFMKGDRRPPSPQDAPAWHAALAQRVALAKDYLAACDAAIDLYTREVLPDQLKQAQQDKQQFLDDLADLAPLIEAFPDTPGNPDNPDSADAFHTQTLDYTLDGKQNQANKYVTGDTFPAGTVLYLFPNTEDRWHTGRGGWVDFRGRNRIPYMRMRCIFSGKGYVVDSGLPVIATDPDAELIFYVEDQWPENNQGSIRIQVVAFTPHPPTP